jgi:hypothetical protein
MRWKHLRQLLMLNKIAFHLVSGLMRNLEIPSWWTGLYMLLEECQEIVLGVKAIHLHL